jgi:hypothetical protein
MIILKYWREIIIGIAACLLIAGIVYVKQVFSERDKLAAENVVIKEQLQSAAKLMDLANSITTAISQIKIRSNVNVQQIESEDKPVFYDSSPVIFIPAGMLQSVYSSSTANRAATGNAGGGNIPSGQPDL